MRTAALVGLVAVVGLTSACHHSNSPTFTLYRSEAVGDTARIHVATFDAVDDEEGYNRATCERARELFQVQPSNVARYWCEAGTFRARRR